MPRLQHVVLVAGLVVVLAASGPLALVTVGASPPSDVPLYVFAAGNVCVAIGCVMRG